MSEQPSAKRDWPRFHCFGGIEGVYLLFVVNQVRHRVTGLFGMSWDNGFIGVMRTIPYPIKDTTNV